MVLISDEMSQVLKIYFHFTQCCIAIPIRTLSILPLFGWGAFLSGRGYGRVSEPEASAPNIMQRQYSNEAPRPKGTGYLHNKSLESSASASPICSFLLAQCGAKASDSREITMFDPRVGGMIPILDSKPHRVIF
jgi:hypothetical protein